MITLYNLASMYSGLVGSTDNISELSASFFTIFGDQGDLSPIQSLTKSWEVPYLARINGVPESTYRATPTDGLGIDAGDEAQLGCSYLEWDLMINEMSLKDCTDLVSLSSEMNLDDRAIIVFGAVTGRMGAGWFKRMHPINLNHPLADRFGTLNRLDHNLFRPECVK
jgi:NAD+ synthetase